MEGDWPSQCRKIWEKTASLSPAFVCYYFLKTFLATFFHFRVCVFKVSYYTVIRLISGVTEAIKVRQKINALLISNLLAALWNHQNQQYLTRPESPWKTQDKMKTDFVIAACQDSWLRRLKCDTLSTGILFLTPCSWMMMMNARSLRMPSMVRGRWEIWPRQQQQ